MDWTGLVTILILTLSIVLWTVSFIQLNKHGGKRGTRQFFFMFFLMLMVGGILFVVLMIPTMNCLGYMCGFESALYFLGGCLFMLIFFPVIMLTVHVSLLKRRQRHNAFPPVSKK